MAKRRLLVIINPISGTVDKTGLDDYIIARFAKADIEADVKWTTGKGDGLRMAAMAVMQHYDGVLAVGGDGTINECASGLCNSNVALGIIPMGSGNGLARHLSLPFNISKALKVVEDGVVKQCDYGSINDRPFFCTSGIGFDAAVSARFAKQKRRGPSSYVKSVIQEYQKFRPSEYIFRMGDKTVTHIASIVALCNASQYGNNAYIAPHADITDGLLDVKVVHVGNLVTNGMAILGMMTGYIDNNVLVDTFKTDSLTIIRQEPGFVHIDGDPVTMGTTLKVKCHKGGLNVYVPPMDQKFKPLLTPIRSSIEIFNDTHFGANNWKRNLKDKI